MTRYLLVVFLAIMPLAAVAQTDETCIAYMEADAAYDTARDKADPARLAAIDAASSRLKAARVAAESQRDAALREANEIRDAARAASDETKAAYDAAVKKAIAAATAAGDKASEAKHAAWRAADEAHKQAMERRRAIKDFDKSSAAFSKADAVKRAAYKQADEALEAAGRQITVAYNDAVHQPKAADEKAQIVRREVAANYIKPYTAYEAAIRVITATYEAERRAADARRNAALDAAVRVLSAIYWEVYDGPTSKVDSVMLKLLEADRDRCRDRFGQ